MKQIWHGYRTPLDYYMSKQGITDNRMARELGMNQPTISRYRSGKRVRPHDELFERIADYLGVTVMELKGKPLGDVLPPEAINIARLWLSLEPQQRKTARNILEALQGAVPDKKDEEPPVVPPKPHR